jgi:hypothetical protein
LSTRWAIGPSWVKEKQEREVWEAVVMAPL